MMKNIYVSLFTGLLSYGLQAQITLTQANHVPLVGDSHNHIFDNSPMVDWEVDGVNVSWDFSSLSGTNSSLDIIEPPIEDLNQSATIAIGFDILTPEGLISSYDYYAASSSSLEIVAQQVPPNSEINFSNSRKVLSFPMSYGDSFNDDFVGSFDFNNAGPVSNREGTTIVTADAFGNLIMPYGVISDVLRVKSITQIYDTNFSIATETKYNWYHSNRRFPIVTYYSLTYEDEGNSIEYMNYMPAEDVGELAVTDHPEINKINIFPNPTKGMLHINKNITVRQLEIYDLQGKLIKTFSDFTKTSFDLSDLQVGVYFVRFATESNVYSEKLIVQ